MDLSLQFCSGHVVSVSNVCMVVETTEETRENEGLGTWKLEKKKKPLW